MRKILFICILLSSIIMGTNNSFAQDDKANYSFGGHVFTDDFPITLGFVYLMNPDSYPEVIETAIIDTLGYYYFYNIHAGKYIVKANLDPNDPDHLYFFSTFYPNASFWEEAEVIDLSETSWEYDIHMQVNGDSQQFNGPGKISGNIELIAGKPYVQNVDIMLLDEYMTPIIHVLSNNLGEFNFENLAYGNYILYPQITGLTTHPIYIEIAENQTIFDNISVTIKDGQIASYINENLISESSLKIYPNPSSTILNIQFEVFNASIINTVFYDLSGRVMYEVGAKSRVGQNAQVINTSNWNNGYYICEILLDNQTAIRQKVCVSH